MRLTRKDFNYQAPVLSKLRQLEDIEEELGIDLITLFKAISNFGFYSKKGFEKIEETYIDFDGKLFVTEDFDVLYFNDYGKTWFLTKEELENENSKKTY